MKFSAARSIRLSLSLSLAITLVTTIATTCGAQSQSAPPEPSPVPVQVAPTNPDMPALAPVVRGRSRNSGGTTSPLQSLTGTGSTLLQTGTGSTTLQTGTGSTLLQTGTGSTTLQTGTGSTTLQTGTGSSTLQVGVEKEAGPINILFIVDGSRSMLEPLERGVQKMDSAKMVLQNALSRIPTDVNLGLRVFGQGANTTQPSMFGGGFGGLNMFSECQNSALWVPIGRGNRRSIIEKVRQIKPYGMTPLAYAIEQAATHDFRGLEGRKVIILITDGADTCNGNPCEMVARLPLYGIKLKVDVVGLALSREPDARRQLDCIAKRSGGNYYDAKSSAELINSISTSVSKAIEGRVIIRPSTPTPEGGGAPINTETPIDMVPIVPERN